MAARMEEEDVRFGQRAGGIGTVFGGQRAGGWDAAFGSYPGGAR